MYTVDIFPDFAVLKEQSNQIFDLKFSLFAPTLATDQQVKISQPSYSNFRFEKMTPRA